MIRITISSLILVLTLTPCGISLAQSPSEQKEQNQVSKDIEELSQLLGKGQYDEAAKLGEKILEVRKRILVEENPAYAESLALLALAYNHMGNFPRAESLLLEAINIQAKVLGLEHPEHLGNLEFLAMIYHVNGYYTRAEPLYLKLKNIQAKVLGAQHPEYASTLNSLARLYQDMEYFACAELLFLENKKILSEALGTEHVDYAHALSSLAGLYRNMGAIARAEPLLLEAKKIQVEVLGTEHPDYLSTLNDLAALYRIMGDYARAEPLFLETKKMRAKVLGTETLGYANTLNSLAVLYAVMGDHLQAAPLYLEAIKIEAKVLGTEHPSYAQLLSNLAQLYESIGDYTRAEPLYRKARTIRAKVLGTTHPDYAASLNNLSELYLRTNEPNQSIRYKDLALRSARSHLVRVLPSLSTRQRKAYLSSNIDSSVRSALSIGYHMRSNQRGATLSAGWLLNTKGMLQEAEAEAALLSHPDAVGSVQLLRTIRKQLAELTLSLATNPTQKKRSRLVELENRQSKVNQKLAAFRLNDVENPWVNIGNIQGSLPFGSVMINIAKFQLEELPKAKNKVNDKKKAAKTAANKDGKTDSKEKSKAPTIYVAWLIPASGEGEVKLVPLGDASAIEPKIKALRKQLTASALNRIQDEGEEKLEQEFVQLSKDLSDSVFAPLEKHLANFEEIIVSPDGELWTIPWELLRTADSQYLLEKYRIRYLTSGRELVSRQRARSGISQPVVMADPDYDLSPGQISSVNAINKQSLRSAATASFGRLPGSRSEAEAIRPALEAYTKSQSKLLIGSAAQEGAFKQLHRPQSLIISTHGYFEQQDTENTTAQSFVNPLLRCGLALAGANNRQQAAADGKEDGILTGLEIVGTDLRGTELVVLSACETGLGDIQNGEGVAGLRQAFQLAGAESVVSSLWQVEDGETARLMKLFFENLAAGKSKSEALRQAQLTRINARRTRHGAAHPFFWAAFTLTGQD